MKFEWRDNAIGTQRTLMRATLGCGTMYGIQRREGMS
jgi:hypothetical protein